MRYTAVAALLPIVMVIAAPGGAAAQVQPQQYEFDEERSRIFVVTYRTGLLSFLGHEHAILVQDWAGDLCWMDAPLARGRGALRVNAQTLAIDTDSARALAGLGGSPSAGQLRTIRRKLVDAEHLSTEAYPSIVLDSLSAQATESGEWIAGGRLTIRDVSRSVRMTFTRAQSGGSLRLSGTLRVRQSDFGIRPESIAGVVRVADPVDIHFDLVATPANRPCTGVLP